MDNETLSFVHEIERVDNRLGEARKILNYLEKEDDTYLGTVEILVGYCEKRFMRLEKETAINVFAGLEHHYSKRLETLTKAIDLDALKELEEKEGKGN